MGSSIDFPLVLEDRIIAASDVDKVAVHEAVLKDNAERDPGDVAETTRAGEGRGGKARGLPGALVIGADQALSRNGKILAKPTDPNAVPRHSVRAPRQNASAPPGSRARRRTQVTFIETPHPTIRPFSPQFLGNTLLPPVLESMSGLGVGWRLSARNTFSERCVGKVG